MTVSPRMPVAPHVPGAVAAARTRADPPVVRASGLVAEVTLERSSTRSPLRRQDVDRVAADPPQAAVAEPAVRWDSTAPPAGVQHARPRGRCSSVERARVQRRRDRTPGSASAANRELVVDLLGRRSPAPGAVAGPGRRTGAGPGSSVRASRRPRFVCGSPGIARSAAQTNRGWVARSSHEA